MSGQGQACSTRARLPICSSPLHLLMPFGVLPQNSPNLPSNLAGSTSMLQNNSFYIPDQAIWPLPVSVQWLDSSVCTNWLLKYNLSRGFRVILIPFFAFFYLLQNKFGIALPLLPPIFGNAIGKDNLSYWGTWRAPYSKLKKRRERFGRSE